MLAGGGTLIAWSHQLGRDDAAAILQMSAQSRSSRMQRTIAFTLSSSRQASLHISQATRHSRTEPWMFMKRPRKRLYRKKPELRKNSWFTGTSTEGVQEFPQRDMDPKSIYAIQFIHYPPDDLPISAHKLYRVLKVETDRDDTNDRDDDRDGELSEDGPDDLNGADTDGFNGTGACTGKVRSGVRSRGDAVAAQPQPQVPIREMDETFVESAGIGAANERPRRDLDHLLFDRHFLRHRRHFR